jgi:hypothetical protein
MTFGTLSDLLLAYETEELPEDEHLDLFAALVREGWAWTLPGRYGREAAMLIEGGYLSPGGEIQRRPSDDY